MDPEPVKTARSGGDGLFDFSEQQMQIQMLVIFHKVEENVRSIAELSVS